jgi:AbrB family looped-hinge helix DNA binding protein
MSLAYSIIQGKGQVTLPASYRRALGWAPGTRVAIELEGGHLVVRSQPGLAEVRSAIEREARAAGTWGEPVRPGDAWAAHAADKEASARGQS